MSYHHWDEEEEEEEWSWYYVSMYHPEYLIPIATDWPVCAAGFEQAMDVYTLLLKLSK